MRYLRKSEYDRRKLPARESDDVFLSSIVASVAKKMRVALAVSKHSANLLRNSTIGTLRVFGALQRTFESLEELLRQLLSTKIALCCEILKIWLREMICALPNHDYVHNRE